MTRPPGRHPRRRITLREERRVVRVLTEGEVTERGYLREWARRNRRAVRLDLADAGMTPVALVRRAREHARQNRRTRRADREFDEIWCVFDTDEHENLPQALEEARQSGVEVAVPIRASSSGSCCTCRSRPLTSIATTFNVCQANWDSSMARGSPIPRGTPSSEASRPRNSARRRWMNATRAMAHRHGRTPAATSGDSWIGYGTASEPVGATV